MKETLNRITIDVCVIGAGAAGLSAASGAVQLGMDTALIERDRMGGDCLYTGCVPSKSLIAAAESAQNFRDSEKFGVYPQNPKIDFGAVMAHMRGVIRDIEPHDSPERYEGMGVKIFHEAARFINEKQVQAGDHIIEARYFVIATGSRPRIPDIPGLDKDRVLTNETIFNLKERPEHLAVIGGGPIGAEMAQAFRRLGSAVTLLSNSSLLPREDKEAAAVIRVQMHREGLDIIEGAGIESVRHTKEGHEISYKVSGKEKKLKATHILVATGRTPVYETLDLSNAGVCVDKNGIQVDGHLRTTNKRIYALGDVAGGPQFTHAAGYHASIFVQHALFKNFLAKTDYRSLPRVTYTAPELAHAGLSCEEAKKTYGDTVQIVRWDIKENDRAKAERRTEGFIRIIVHKDRPVGVTIVGAHAGELISLWALAIRQKMKLSAVAQTIFPYPTLSEVSKYAAGSFYKPALFSERTRGILSVLKKLPRF